MADQPETTSLCDQFTVRLIYYDLYTADHFIQCASFTYSFDFLSFPLQIDGDFVHYKNALIYKEMGAGPIVREHRWRVDLQCNFKRQMKVG